MSLEPTPEEIRQLKLKKARRAKFDDVIDDLYLTHRFFLKHKEDIWEEAADALMELDRTVGILGVGDIDAVNALRRLLKKIWNEIDPEEKLHWIELRDEWNKKVYKDYTLKQLLTKRWDSRNVREFAEKLGVSYQTAYYTVLPKIAKVLKESKFKFLDVTDEVLNDMLEMVDRNHF